MPQATETGPEETAGYAGRAAMITLSVERRYGTATVRSRITVPSIERALELCSGDARFVVPAEIEHFRGPNDAVGRAAERRPKAA